MTMAITMTMEMVTSMAMAVVVAGGVFLVIFFGWCFLLGDFMFILVLVPISFNLVIYRVINFIPIAK